MFRKQNKQNEHSKFPADLVFFPGLFTKPVYRVCEFLLLFMRVLQTVSERETKLHI